MARPHVVAHLAVSLEGATTGFAPDLAKFYELAATWKEDVTLVGADTILAQEEALAGAPQPGPAADGPLLAIVDSHARVREWTALRNAGHWSDVLALYAESTPPRRTDHTAGGDVDELVIGTDRVDLAAAIDALGERHNARTVRVDSGGALTGALLDGGLLDEISLLVHPCLVGSGERRWYGESSASGDVEPIASETFDGGLLWLRYRVPSAADRLAER
jgi:2,5-diamino-6-(ribosylamino)-4(3H)-pyrimidinone 5'-phosphate reductase